MMSTGDSQLLPVLSNASDSELAPLVEYITKAFSSGIESKARYKTHCPAHSRCSGTESCSHTSPGPPPPQLHISIGNLGHIFRLLH